MKNKKIFFIIMLFIIIIIISFILKKTDYNIEYNIDDFVITESYIKSEDSYSFSIKYQDINFSFLKVNKTKLSKKIIKSIEIYENEEQTQLCLLPKSKKLDFYPICEQDGEIVSYNFIDINNDFYKYENYKKEDRTYKNITINTLLNHNYLIWANKGYYLINEKDTKEILFLDKESYYNNLSYQIDEYIITPNYDENYMFNSISVINLKNGKNKLWDLNHSISYNSYYLGTHTNNIYLFDRKNEKEYLINPKKEKIEIVSKDGFGKVWDLRWKEISTTKLSNTNYEFSDKYAITYVLEDNKLYMNYNNYKVLISKKKVDKIIKIDYEEVFYLVGDELYYNSPKYGEVMLLKYSEWAFNNVNSIFVY